MNTNTYHYIALVRDASRGTLVLAVQAADTRKVRSLVHAFYERQGWAQQELLSLWIKRVHLSPEKPVQFMRWTDELHLQQQILTLCRKLLDQADGADLTIERDALYAFVGQFESGKRAIEERYPRC